MALLCCHLHKEMNDLVEEGCVCVCVCIRCVSEKERGEKGGEGHLRCKSCCVDSTPAALF